MSTQDKAPAARHVVVFGASGVVGGAVLELFCRTPGWKVTAVSRRKPGPSSFSDPALLSTATFDHLRVDLRDRESCAQLETLTTVTHVVYAALYETQGLWQGWSDPAVMEVNRLMLDHTLQALVKANAPLKHITVIHGGKAYGIVAGRKEYPIPLRERDADRQHASFYWLQERLVQRVSKERGFAYTIFWPMIIPGAAVGVNMNPVALLGVYAAIRAEEGLPLSYPGPPGLNVNQMTDCRLLARGCLHAATTEATWGDAFNLVNGDVADWRSLWPAIARATGHSAQAPDEELDLAQYITQRAGVWKRVVARHGLLGSDDVAEFLGESLHYGPMLLTPTPRPIILSGHKLAMTGFRDGEDTEESMVYWLRNMQSRGLLP